MKKLLLAVLLFTASIKLTAQVKVLGTIVPNAAGDQYPTHLDTYGKGGVMCVASISERNAITTLRRKSGMIVVVAGVTSTAYQLQPDLTTWGQIYFPSSFSNGLTINSNAVKLGGTLTEATTININNNPFSLANGSGYFKWDGERVIFVQSTNASNQLIGFDAAYNNSGNFLTAWGTNALIDGTGDYKIAIGTRALRQHIGNYSTAYGDYVLQNSNGDNNNGVGYGAGSTAYTDHSNFFGTNTSAGLLVDSITINNTNILIEQPTPGVYTSSKIGGVSALISRLGLVANDNRFYRVVFSGTPPLVNDGLGRRSFYEEKGQVTSSDTLLLYMGKFIDQGSGTMTVYVYAATSNVVVIGDSARAETSNMAVVGNGLTTTFKTGKLSVSLPASSVTHIEPNKNGTYAMTSDIAPTLDSSSTSIYNKSFWTNSSDFSITGATVTTQTNGTLRLSGGLANFTQTVILTGYQNNDENKDYEITAKCVTLGATAYGFSIGEKSVNPWYTASIAFRFDPTTGLIYVYNAANTAISTVSTGITVAVNDVIRLVYSRRGNLITLSFYDITQNLSFITSLVGNMSPTKNIIPPNSNNLCINNFGGTFDIQNIKITSFSYRKPYIMFVGDSKTFGYSTSNFPLRFADLSKSLGITSAFSGDGDRTTELVNDTGYLFKIKPKYIVLCIGRNDSASGVSPAIWHNNYQNIVNAAQSHGIIVVHILPIPEANSSLGLQTTIKNWINSTYAGGYIIDPSAGWNNTLYLSSDSVHMSVDGHRYIWSLIVSSGIFTARNENYTIPLPSVPFFANSIWVTNGTNIYNTNNGSVGVGTNSPNSSSLMDLTSTTKGALLPRMTSASINSISSPVGGLIAYSTTRQSYRYYDSVQSKWRKYFSGDTTIVTDGAIPIGKTSTGDFAVSTITAGPGLTVTNAPGAITIGYDVPTQTVTTATYTATSTNRVIFVSYSAGTANITLPSASGNPGKMIWVRNLDSSRDVLLTGMAATEANTISAQNAFTVVSNGTDWYVISNYH